MTDLDAIPTPDDIAAAAKRLEGVAQRTPMLESPFLNERAGRRVLVKAESLQRTGSFKFRGAYTALSALPPEARERGVITYSSGNHAQGVAHAAEILGIPALIIMPEDAPRLKLENTKAYGAEVMTYDRAGEVRETLGGKVAAARGLTLVKPYDDARVIMGQASTGLEIAEQARELGVEKADVIVCCGGGGLASGTALAVETAAPGLRVRTAEPQGFDDWKRSLASGSRQTNPALSGSICDAILTPTPGALPWSILESRAGPGLAISDDEAMAAMAAAFLHLKLVLEPGGAAALAAVLSRADEIEGDAVICIATGGNVDPSRFTEALRRFG